MTSQPTVDAAVSTLDRLCGSFDREDGPGLVVGVAHRDEILYRRAFGLASLEHKVRNTPETRMRLASITKHFACFGALLLAEQGKLDLDAPANRILPELPALSGMPTLRQFMNHTSGYHCFMELFFVGSGGFAWHPKGAGLALQMAQTDVSFRPGEKQLYCNGGYELLSEAIARASGTSFEQYMLDSVFKPLGMAHSLCVPNDLLVVPGMAGCYMALPDGSWMRGTTPMEDNRGAGAMVTTVDDMLLWMSQLRGKHRAVGSADSWRQLTEVATLNNGQMTPYALGLFRHKHKGIEVLHHGGSLAGVATQMVTVPAHELDIIIMSNGAQVNPLQLGWDIIEALLPQQVRDETPPLVAVERFKHLLGTRYHHPASGMVYGFGEVAGHLGLSLVNSPFAPILRERGEVIGFRMEEAGMGPLEIRIADLAPTANGAAPPQLTISECGQAERFERLPAIPPSTRALGELLLGRYRSEDLQADASIRFDGEELVLRFVTEVGTREGVLEAQSGTVMSYTVRDPLIPARYALTLVQGAGGDVTGLILTTARARCIRFTRLPA